MSYLISLIPNQLSNIYTIIDEMKKSGITNPYIQAGILSVVSKESSFVPKRETGYSKTSNDRIKSIFSKTRVLSDKDLNIIKSSDETFFNFVYGGMYGNKLNEGYKYRGGGYNQLTFRDNYNSIGKRIGVDLVNNPDKINEPDTASKSLIDYYLREFKKVNKNINNYTNINDALIDAFKATNGWSKAISKSTGGFEKAESRINEFYLLVNNSLKKK